MSETPCQHCFGVFVVALNPLAQDPTTLCLGKLGVSGVSRGTSVCCLPRSTWCPLIPFVMTDESTVPFGVHAQGVGKIEVSDDDADASGEGNMEGGGDTALDASQRLLNEAAARDVSRTHVVDTRGRPRERERAGERESGRPRPHPKPSPGVRVPASPTERELEDAAIAAEALAAAMSCAPVPDGGHSLDSVRHLAGAGLPDRNLSPEKRARTTANKAPHFGAYPPVFHGPAGTPGGGCPPWGD